MCCMILLLVIDITQESLMRLVHNLGVLYLSTLHWGMTSFFCGDRGTGKRTCFVMLLALWMLHVQAVPTATRALKSSPPSTIGILCLCHELSSNLWSFLPNSFSNWYYVVLATWLLLEGWLPKVTARIPLGLRNCNLSAMIMEEQTRLY